MGRSNRSLSVLLFFSALVAAMSPSVGRGQSVEVRNGIGHSVHLWIWPENQNPHRPGWVRPVPYLPSRGTVRLPLATAGRNFLVVRDRANNDDPLGWVDMNRIIARHPDAKFLIAGGYRQRERSEEYQVTTMRHEERSRTVRVWDGTQFVEREQNYKVAVPQTETRTRLVQENALDVDLMVELDGQIASVFDLYAEDVAIAAIDPFSDELAPADPGPGATPDAASSPE